MVGVKTSVDAHATIVAVLEILGTTYTAKSTIRTMIGSFIVVHPEIANIAVVLSELDTTLDAIVSLTRLACKTLPANNFLDGKSINGMVRIHGSLLSHGGKATGKRSTAMHPVTQLNLGWQNRTIVVTNTTAKSCTAARSNHGTVPLVMRTGRTRLFHPPDLFAGGKAILSSSLVSVRGGVNGQGRSARP